ncbi:MAG TPA: methyltransferase domain-containing protein [Alphaproteobacteria bacterium]|nr:methyltransferase domain-containing protein [Alphaproteobacteria bacterium]
MNDHNRIDGKDGKTWGAALRGIDLASVKFAYRRYASVYDLIFGAVLEPGRQAAIAAVNVHPGQRILEVGIGTGLSLPAYRKDARVIGIDISREMLSKARQRVARLGLAQVEALLEMDGERMAFADGSFDAVMGMYIVGVTPRPASLLREMQRVCRAGGDIVVINHFASQHPMLRLFEGAVAPLSARIGFRPNLALEAITGIDGMELEEIRNINLFNGAKLLRFRNRPPAAALRATMLSEGRVASGL